MYKEPAGRGQVGREWGKRFIFLLLIFSFFAVLMPEQLPASSQDILIVLDPGHGGENTGVIGAGGLAEKDVCLDLALRVKKRIDQRLGYPTFLTRSRDLTLSLKARASQANNHLGSVYISIHLAGFPAQSFQGFGTYTFDPSQTMLFPKNEMTPTLPQWDAQQLPHLESSRRLARMLHETLQNGLPEQRDLGMHSMPLYPFGALGMPAVLIEPAVLTSPIQEDHLRQEEFKEKIAESIFQGIDEWIRSVYPGERHE
jgi:N-acetylmuramoyl-L-alanine amidase